MGTQADSVTSAASPKEIRQDIEQTRAGMSDTLEKLHGRLNPTVLKEQAIEQFRDAKETVKAELKQEWDSATQSLRSDVLAELEDVKQRLQNELAGAKSALRDATIGKVEHMVNGAQETMRETGNSVVSTIKNNPLPAALAGIGLAWLFLNRTKPRASSQHMGATIQTAAQRLKHEMGGQTEKIADDVSRRAGEIAHEAKDAVAFMAQSTADRAMLGKIQVRAAYQANPLIFGAGAFVAGTAFGLAIPISKREVELLAGAQLGAVKGAESLAREALDKVQTVATHVSDNITTALSDQPARAAAKPNVR